LIQRLNAGEILRELVAISTPSMQSNLPLICWVDNYLQRLGWQIEIHKYQDERGVEKGNLVARPSYCDTKEAVELAFICHTDTVPFPSGWSDALRLVEREGQQHGCGACDVKGSLACFLAAVADGTSKNIALILTADEEVGCKGMERLLVSTKLKIRSAIVSEPTSLRAGIAGKGYGLARVTVHGREAHSAFPNQGLSAISCAAKLIVSIEERFNRPGPLGEDVLFDPPRTTVNIGVIEGGSAKNIVPGQCAFLVEWRSLPGDDPSAVLLQLRELVADVEQVDLRLSVTVEAMRAEPGFAPIAGGSLQMRLAQLLNSKPVGISFGSEATRVARIADEVIVIGPGDMRTAHSDRECVPITELESWTKTLHRLFASSE